MRRYGLKAVPTDKDGGYAIICKEHLDDLIQNKAKPPIYEPISEHAANPSNIMSSYFRALHTAKKVFEGSGCETL